MKVAILCGGKGSRMGDVTEVVPKPMLTIGGKPVLWHIMKYYASFGHTDFVLALGHKSWVIKEYFLNYHAMSSDLTLTLGKPSDISFLDDIQETGWRITLADTGAETTTGGRVWLLRKYLEGDDLFCLTYGDAVADLDLDALIQQHRASGLAGTISAVKMGGRFGEMQHSDGKVVSFEEKPAVSAGRVNGGYMVFNAKAAWDYFQPNDTYMEQGALLRMMDAGQLGCYLHEGRWQCMDTPREHAILNALWDHGDAFWKRR